ncbi:hypothetical protein [Xanthobacter sediminis]
MKRPRHICPECGSVAVDVGPKAMTCLHCGYRARRFPGATDPVPEPEHWDGRPRNGGQVLKIRGAE